MCKTNKQQGQIILDTKRHAELWSKCIVTTYMHAFWPSMGLAMSEQFDSLCVRAAPPIFGKKSIVAGEVRVKHILDMIFCAPPASIWCSCGPADFRHEETQLDTSTFYNIRHE